MRSHDTNQYSSSPVMVIGVKVRGEFGRLAKIMINDVHSGRKRLFVNIFHLKLVMFLLSNTGYFFYFSSYGIMGTSPVA